MSIKSITAGVADSLGSQDARHRREGLNLGKIQYIDAIGRANPLPLDVGENPALRVVERGDLSSDGMHGFASPQPVGNGVSDLDLMRQCRLVAHVYFYSVVRHRCNRRMGGACQIKGS